MWEHSLLLRVTLFTFRVNVDHGESEERNMITGLHTVRDISCSKCKTIVGWTYVSLLYAAVSASRGGHWPTVFPFIHSQVKAVEESQKYKEGKFILEKALLEKLAEVAWMMIPIGLSFFRLSSLYFFSCMLLNFFISSLLQWHTLVDYIHFLRLLFIFFLLLLLCGLCVGLFDFL